MYRVLPCAVILFVLSGVGSMDGSGDWITGIYVLRYRVNHISNFSGCIIRILDEGRVSWSANLPSANCIEADLIPLKILLPSNYQGERLWNTRYPSAGIRQPCNADHWGRADPISIGIIIKIT